MPDVLTQDQWDHVLAFTEDVFKRFTGNLDELADLKAEKGTVELGGIADLDSVIAIAAAHGIAVASTPKDSRTQLQEVYLHLDATGSAGNSHIAWYGQLRAEEHSHAEALRMTVEHFHLKDAEWYQKRLARVNGA